MDNVIPINSRKGVKMLKLNYKTINSRQFGEAIEQLAAHDGYPSFDSTYNILKITREFNKEINQARELFVKWVDQFVEKDEAGNKIWAKNPNPYCPWEIMPDKQESFAKGLQEFLNTEITILAKPLTKSDVESVGLSPKVLLALEPIFDLSSFEQEVLQS